ncbi:metal-dependent amidase/aminoacylase/carboxypeptidase [Saccharata proteae CBS 121410]|uniref:Metal-dependent amidase/aminoacylase/carboxypeptidase n=1 Tax=Saccharata proteae CBS 121410 TaxID=1314787 RepID=A0A9P4HUN1_9PEZI|nr:metal-dependent amidase/aminoacylase/carboxypeptidase [Saccharata proteae CBS 121410]
MKDPNGVHTADNSHSNSFTTESRRDSLAWWNKPANRVDRDLRSIVDRHLPLLDTHFVPIYKRLHEQPELGGREIRTAAIIGEYLKALGFQQVHEHIGGHGIAAVLENGNGPTVLLRASMDALPIREDSYLSYASKIPGIMHASGHDMQSTCLLAACALLCSAHTEWRGTLIAIFQPDSERGKGALAMLTAGLYTKIPKPDIILAQRVDHKRAGSLAIRPGLSMAAADSFAIRIPGRGGHSSEPQNCIDPIVTASYVIVRLQSIVSRAVAPLDSVVLTCAAIHAGDSETVIPDFCDLKVNVQSFKADVREDVILTMKDLVKSECRASQLTEHPRIEQTAQFPRTHNDPDATEIVKTALSSYFGDENMEEQEVLVGSEDLSNLSSEGEVPVVLWFFGGTPPELWDEAVSKGQGHALPRCHSSGFAPIIQPTMEVGTKAMAVAALSFFH